MSERIRIDVHSKPETLEDRIQDEEIFPYFVEEATEIFKQVNADLHKWDHNPGNPEILEDIRRGFHTLKSAARSIGLQKMGHVAYHAELICQNVSLLENYNMKAFMRTLICVSDGLQESLGMNTQHVTPEESFYDHMHKVINDFRQEIS